MFCTRKPILVVTLGLEMDDMYHTKMQFISRDLKLMLSEDYYLIFLNDPDQAEQAKFELLSVKNVSKKTIDELQGKIDSTIVKLIK